jgi:hypothetical protein
LCNITVLEWCLSMALAFVPQQGWLRCLGPHLFEWGGSSSSTTLGDMWLVPRMLLTSWEMPWPSGVSSIMSTTSPSLSCLGFKLRVPSAILVLGLASLGLCELLAHIVALNTDVDRSTSAFLNGKLPSLCSGLFQDTAPANVNLQGP